MRVVSLLIWLSILLTPKGVLAQAMSDYDIPVHVMNRILAIEVDDEHGIRGQAPEYRLLRDVEALPPLEGQTKEISIILSDTDLERVTRPNMPPLIATLHDRRSGRPLDNCQAPCTLHTPTVPPGIITFYRYGSRSWYTPAESYVYYDNSAPVYLGFNEVEHQIERDRCAEEFEGIKMLETNRSAEPCVRVPPRMPPEAEHSAYCMATFNISHFGEVMDARVEECTAQIFCEPRLEAIRRWIYYPKLQYGEVRESYGEENKMSYRLTDENGLLIAEPEGEMQPCVGSA